MRGQVITDFIVDHRFKYDYHMLVFAHRIFILMDRSIEKNKGKVVYETSVRFDYPCTLVYKL